MEVGVDLTWSQRRGCSPLCAHCRHILVRCSDPLPGTAQNHDSLLQMRGFRHWCPNPLRTNASNDKTPNDVPWNAVHCRPWHTCALIYRRFTTATSNSLHWRRSYTNSWSSFRQNRLLRIALEQSGKFPKLQHLFWKSDEFRYLLGFPVISHELISHDKLILTEVLVRQY